MKTTLTQVQEMFPLPEEAIIPFREAEICYKAGAYRASLLFSYLGWGLTLRARLVQANCPAGIQLTQWQAYQSYLQSEDRWDSQVFDLTQMQNPVSVFLVSEDLRHQVRYWKDRRNDCAHFKKNEIDHSYVESFWLFMLSNLSKFVPNGSAQSLLNELLVHFDPSQTPPNKSVDSIAERIPNCVDNAELVHFFQQLVDTLQFTSGNTTFRRTHEINVVIDAVIRLTDEPTIMALSTFLVSNEECLLEFILEYPQHVRLLDQQPQLVRRIWHQYLFSSWHEGLPVFAALLRNNLIPPEEIQEAMNHVVYQLRVGKPSTSDIITLEQHGFFRSFESIAFTERQLDDFKWGNRNAQFVRWYLETYPISVTAVKAICGIFSSKPYPFEARDALGELFQGNQQKRQEFENIVQQENLALPQDIFGNETA